MMNFVYTLCSSTPGQIQYGGFKRALAKKSGDMIRDRVRILYLLFLCPCHSTVCKLSLRKIVVIKNINLEPGQATIGACY